MKSIEEVNQCDMEDMHKKCMRMITGTVDSLYHHTKDNCHLNECQMSLLKDSLKSLKYLHELSKN